MWDCKSQLQSYTRVVWYRELWLARCRSSLKSNCLTWKHSECLADSWSRVRLLHLACSREQIPLKTKRRGCAALIASLSDMHLRSYSRKISLLIIWQIVCLLWIKMIMHGVFCFCNYINGSNNSIVSHRFM